MSPSSARTSTSPCAASRPAPSSRSGLKSRAASIPETASSPAASMVWKMASSFESNNQEAAMDTLVDINNVRKVYKRDAFEVPVLNGVTLAVPRGDFLALMGPSGSGKTTLLNLMAGIDRPTGGRIFVDGKEISRFSETQLASWRSRHVGFIFQMYNLIPALNAFDNVELPLLLTKLSKKERREHVQAALGIVGLRDRSLHYPRQRAGGQA